MPWPGSGPCLFTKLGNHFENLGLVLLMLALIMMFLLLHQFRCDVFDKLPQA